MRESKRSHLTGSNRGRENANTKKVISVIDAPKPASFAISEGSISEALKELITGLGYNLLTMTPDEKGVVAEKLSRLARQSPPWTWRYVHNVIGRKIEPSERMAGAILALGAVIDGANPLMVQARRVQVYAVRPVKPGAVIMAGSRPCANPSCPIEFVPIVPRQRFCCAGCRERARHRGSP